MFGLQYCKHKYGLYLLLLLGYMSLFLLLLSYVHTRPKLAMIEDKEPPLLVLVISSLTRSGSSLMGELIATIPDSVYYFEPIFKFIDNKKYDQNNILGYINSLFTCEFDKEFEAWFKRKLNLLKWWDIKAKICTNMQDYLNCVSKLNIKKDCEQANAIIMKVVRARISWLEPFIIDNQFQHFKVIHMVRDPRASMKSIMNFNGWNKDVKHRCSLLHQDLEAYKQLKNKYNNTIIRVTLEELSLKPLSTTQRIFQFLYGNTTLPNDTSRYIWSHMNYQGSDNDVWSLYKNSMVQYQDWRWNISQALLRQVEEEPGCREAIQELGYTIFGSEDNVRNKSIPLIKEI